MKIKLAKWMIKYLLGIGGVLLINTSLWASIIPTFSEDGRSRGTIKSTPAGGGAHAAEPTKEQQLFDEANSLKKSAGLRDDERRLLSDFIEKGTSINKVLGHYSSAMLASGQSSAGENEYQKKLGMLQRKAHLFRSIFVEYVGQLKLMVVPMGTASTQLDLGRFETQMNDTYRDFMNTYESMMK